MLGDSQAGVPSGLTAELLVAFSVLFVLGFVLYAVLFAAIGSLVSRQEDVSQIVTPLTLAASAGYLVAVYTSIGTFDPNAPWVAALSWVPFLSPYMMLSRLGVGTAGIPEVAAFGPDPAGHDRRRDVDRRSRLRRGRSHVRAEAEHSRDVEGDSGGQLDADSVSRDQVPRVHTAGGPAQRRERSKMPVTGTREQSPHLQPRWFIRSFWVAHRALYSNHRRSGRASTPDDRRAGACCASGRSGVARARSAARSSATYEDGPNLVTLAMNGWAERRAGLVAQPPGTPRRDRRSGRRAAQGQGARRRGRRARSPLGRVARRRRRCRRLRAIAVLRDGGRGPGATASR